MCWKNEFFLLKIRVKKPKKVFFKIKKRRKHLMENKIDEKNIAGLGIEPQTYKMS